MDFTLPTSDPIQHSPPYSVLARVYDRMMVHVNYRRWASYIISILKNEQFWPERKLLDIGCGTGRFVEEVQKLGQPGDCCDPSPAMLEIAGKRLLNSRFYHDHLPEIESIPANTYHVFTCLYDTMNYLLDETAFTRALNTVYAKLTSPGLFIFDLVSEAHCKHYFRNYRDSEVLNKSMAYSRESHYDSKERFQYNWIRIYSDKGVFEEEHRQKIYNFRKVRNMVLENTDFELRNIFSEFTYHRATPRSGRAHFILKKND